MKYDFRYKTVTFSVSGMSDELGPQWSGTFNGSATKDFVDTYQLLPYNSNYETYSGYLKVNDVEYAAIFAIHLLQEGSESGAYAAITGKIIDERFKLI